MPTEVIVKGSKRTPMYSIERIEKKNEKGRGTGEYEERVVEHFLPFDSSNKYGTQKLQKFIEKGYTFEKPSIKRREPDLPALTDETPTGTSTEREHVPTGVKRGRKKKGSKKG